MQKVTIAEVKSKSGEGGKSGHWTLVIVVGDDGAEFSSFDTALEKLTPGSVIGIEPEVVIIQGKTKINIKEWKLISEAPAGGPAPGVANNKGGGYRRSLEDDLALEAVKRRSIEGQTAIAEVGRYISDPTDLELAMLPDEDLHRLTVKYWKAIERSLDNFLAEPAPRQAAKSAAAPPPAPRQRPPDEDWDALASASGKRAGFVDLEWLHESLTALQARKLPYWMNTAVIQRINKLTGKDAKSVSEAASNLSKAAAEALTNEIQGILDEICR